MEGKQRLIIVEDERIEAEAVKVCLNSRGFDVVASVATGKEAVEQAKKLMPDLVLMDIMLSGKMDGIQAAEQIIANFKIPIVYLTAYTDDSTLERVKKTAPHGFIIKPFEENELIGVIETALYKHQLEKKLAESEEKFRQFFENEPEYCYMVSSSSIILDINRAALKALGYQKKELIGQHTKIFTAVESVAKMKEVFSKWDQIKVIKDVEMKIVSKNGEKRDVLLSLSAVKDNFGKTIYSVCVQKDITERKQAEQAIHRRDAILDAVSFAAEKFLKASSWKEDIQEVLHRLGSATGVSRIYIFENHSDENGALLTSQRYEWVGENIEAQIDNPDLQNFPLKEYGFNRWIKVMTKGDIIYGLVKKFPKSEKEVLQPQDIQSILVAPIFAEKEWWGFIGFDECTFDREWTQPEIDVLKTAADTLGTAIQRRRTEKALQQSEKRYRQLVDKAPDIIYETDGIGRFTFVNPEGIKLTGYSKDELIGKSYLDLISPNFRKKADRFYTLQIANRKQNTYFEFAFIRKDGSEIYIGQKVQLIFKDDQVVGLQAVARDITERKQTENLLTAQRDLGLALSRTTGLEDTLNYCLDAAIKISGLDSGGIYLVDEVSGHLDLVNYEGVPSSYAQETSHYDAGSVNARMVNAGKQIYLRFKDLNKLPDKAIQREGLRSIAVIPVRHEDRVIGCLNIASHILDEVPIFAHMALETIANQIGNAIIRVKMAQALQQSQKNMETTFDSVEDFLFVLDMEGRILKVNAIVLKRLGYSEKEIIGETVLKVHPEDLHEQAKVIIADMIAGKTKSCPIPLITKGGNQIPVETRITLGRWGDQEVIFGVSRDITEQKKAEYHIAGLNHLKEELLKPGSLAEKMKRITDGVVEIFNVDFARIWMIKAGDQCESGCFHARVKQGPHFCRFRDLCLHLIASSGRYSHINGKVHRRVPFGCYKIGRIAAAKEHKFLTNKVTSDPRVHDHKWAKKLGLVSFAGYRLLSTNGKPLGVLAFFSNHQISSNEDALLENLATTTAQVIQTTKTEQDIRKLNKELEKRVAERTAKLKISEERATIQYKSIPVPTFTWRKVEDDFELVDYNDAAMEFKYGTIADSLGIKASKMYENDPQIRKELAECFTKKTTIEREMEHQFRASKVKKQLLVRCAYAPPDSVLVHAEDITERKRAEEDLRESEEKLKSTISSIDDLVFVLDKDGIFTGYYQPEKSHDLYASPEVFLGKHFKDVLPPHVVMLAEKAIKAVVATNMVQQFDYPLLISGKEMWFSAKISQRKDSSGGFAGVTIVARNITERKNAENEIKILNEILKQRAIELEASNKELESFSYSVSHDLRAPLRAIDGFSKILAEEYSEKLENEPKRLLNIICDNTQNMRQLIDDLVKFSQTSRKELNLISVYSEKLVNEVIDELKQTEPGRNIKFNVKKLPPVSADRGMIKQVFMNLISNAIKFTRLRKTAIIEIGSMKKEKENIFYVKDNGVGFNNKYADKLFGVFQRLHNKKDFEGSGIGLGIVQRIIQKHGGTVRAKGAVNKGATFYFSLPIKNA